MIRTSIGYISKDDFVKRCNENTLPENLTVIGDLNLSGQVRLIALPKGLIVKGSLALLACLSLPALPEGLTVYGILDIESCISLKTLPKGLRVDTIICVSEDFALNYPFKEIPKILHLPFEENRKPIRQIFLKRLQ